MSKLVPPFQAFIYKNFYNSEFFTKKYKNILKKKTYTNSNNKLINNLLYKYKYYKNPSLFTFFSQNTIFLKNYKTKKFKKDITTSLRSKEIFTKILLIITSC